MPVISIFAFIWLSLCLVFRYEVEIEWGFFLFILEFVSGMVIYPLLWNGSVI